MALAIVIISFLNPEKLITNLVYLGEATHSTILNVRHFRHRLSDSKAYRELRF